MSTPLRGVRVLDLTRLLPGNYAAYLLGALGAEVIKIEDPGAGDYMREVGLIVDGQSASHHNVNRAKRSVVIDLKRPEGVEVFLRLVDTADVVIDSFRSGVLDRLGIGESVLRARRPSLVVASISGYGASGPLSGIAAHDINAMAFAGVQERLVGPDGGSFAIEVPFADQIGGGLIPAMGVMALLVQARATGEGGWLDCSLAEGVAVLPSPLSADVLAGAPMPPKTHTTGGNRAHYRVYELLDGQVAVGAFESQFWVGVCEVFGLDDLKDAQWDDSRRVEAIDRLTATFAALTRDEVAELIEGRDCCVSLVNSYEQMFASPHAQARGLVRPAVDVPINVLAPPFRINGSIPPETIGAPRQGQHTVEVLAERGFTGAEIESLLDDKVVAERGANA
ncbi:CaiB/BaiF CoA transferase family protein [Gordonia polyisoprenivorans]|uniref:CaiB/BaiF CoA transferase family protein n=1 Tax=Gordonia polyisoprenivorans TaxID=84595 RepID=UPI001AD65846|nr:CaiB/BaiF CoA-transferase family protein [Gordonia polyisoprenivorans]QTI69936.1 CoA transferase [Gordonia polyisoprenivorans]